MGVGSVVLLASMFALPWYGLSSTLAPTLVTLGHATSWNGWHGLSHLRWLILLTAIAGLALVYLQATRRSPAVPVTMSVVVTVIAGLAVLALIYRVLINPPGSGAAIVEKPGAYVGLASACVIVYGAYRSMRQEGILPSDGPGEIPTVARGGAATSPP